MNVALILIIVAILRRPLPECSFWIEDPEDDDASVRSGSSSIKSKGDAPVSNLARASIAIANLERTESQSTIADGETSRENTEQAEIATETSLENQKSSRIDENDAVDRAEKSNKHLDVDLEANHAKESNAEKGKHSPNSKDSDESDIRNDLESSESAEVKPSKRKKLRGCLTATKKWFNRNAPLLGGIALAQIGMISFSEGLTYAFTVLVRIAFFLVIDSSCAEISICIVLYCIDCI